MAKRVYTKKGDIYEIIVDDTYKRYLQLIGYDLECLNSDTFRVFKKSYPVDYNPTMDEILKDDIDFYVHSFAGGGIHDEIWNLVYRSKDVGKLDGIKFRIIGELPPPGIKFTEYIFSKSTVWTFNGNNMHTICGKLPEEWIGADLGDVLQPKNILHRIKYGKYDWEPIYKE